MYAERTEEQKKILEKVEQFAKDYITEEQVREWYANKGVPEEVTRAYVESGLGFLGFPEEVGGTPASCETQCMVIEELCRISGCYLPFMQNSVALMDMVSFGSPEQVQIAMDTYKSTGTSCFAIAITEPNAGSDNSSMTSCVKEVDGKLILNGNKIYVTNAQKFPYMLVVAKDEDPARENRSYSLWLLPSDTPGVVIEHREKIGNEIMPMCEVYFNDVEIDPSWAVGERGKGFYNLMKNLEFERVFICALTLGLAQASMDDAAKYASERICFGKPIGSFQMIQEKLTDMESKLQVARTYLYYVARMMDRGESVKLETALLKRFTVKNCLDVCSEAVQILGGLGYRVDSRVGRIWIDVRGNQFACGTDEVMVHIAGRELVKRYSE